MVNIINLDNDFNFGLFLMYVLTRSKQSKKTHKKNCHKI